MEPIDVTRWRAGRIELPPFVVTREFPRETVVLNLQTGQYHALNAVAGAMLDALRRTGDFDATIAEVAAAYEAPTAGIERDLAELCEGLLGRGLIVLAAP